MSRTTSGGCLWCGRKAAYRLGLRPLANGRYGPAIYFELCDRHGGDVLDARGIDYVDGYPMATRLLEEDAPLRCRAAM